MKALVINLAKATERMAFQTQQLDTLGIPYQRLPAVSVDDQDEAVYKKYYRSWERPMRHTEVACFFSHKKAWETVVADNSPMLILEDDAYLADNTPCLLQHLSKRNDVDYVNLEVTGSNRKKLVAKQTTLQLCDASLTRLYQGRSGSGGYVLWPSGAQKLLARAKKGNIGLADKFINSSYELRAYQIEPASIIQLDQCKYHGITPPLKAESSISTKTNTITQLEKCLSCKFRRFVAEVRVGLNFLRHSHHASKRHIALSDFFLNKQ